jgi:hypothetical protein
MNKTKLKTLLTPAVKKSVDLDELADSIIALIPKQKSEVIGEVSIAKPRGSRDTYVRKINSDKKVNKNVSFAMTQKQSSLMEKAK